MGNRVTVLMSTYNGEKYVGEQIDSILAQKDVDVHLDIRDDGSSDSTVDIIKKYDDKYDNIHFSAGESLGVGRSFMKLLYEASDSDYYAFADQDDYWYDDKLCVAIEALQEYSDKPTLYCCNQNIVDSDRNFRKIRFPEDLRISGCITGVFHNFYAGCTMVMNRSLRNILVDSDRMPPLDFFERRIHDAWVNCVGSLVGKVIFDNEPHMDFRRHGSAYSDEFVPNQKGRSITRRYFHKFKRFIKRGIKTRHKGCLQTARALLKYYDDYLDEKMRKQLRLIANYDNSVRDKFALLNSNLIDEYVLSDKFLVRVKIFFEIL